MGQQSECKNQAKTIPCFSFVSNVIVHKQKRKQRRHQTTTQTPGFLFMVVHGVSLAITLLFLAARCTTTTTTTIASRRGGSGRHGLSTLDLLTMDRYHLHVHSVVARRGRGSGGWMDCLRMRFTSQHERESERERVKGYKLKQASE